jgi:hypothetical protein
LIKPKNYRAKFSTTCFTVTKKDVATYTNINLSIPTSHYPEHLTWRRMASSLVCRIVLLGIEQAQDAL